MEQKKSFSLQDIIKNSFFISIFILISTFLIIVATNFPYGTWFTGWDNLHPEFNFNLNFKRVLQGVWQYNQGLGTYGGHGYAATLPHTFLLYIMSFFIPSQYLRSIFTLLTHLIGALGIFFLIRTIARNKNESIKNLVSLGSALFYMLNFATVENYFIQLEAFIIHFAALPWLILITIITLDRFNKKNLLLFLIINILATSQGFIPPLFFVYMIFFSIILFFYWIYSRSLITFRKTFFLFLITIFINSYWLFPNIYYSLFKSSTYLNSYNNLVSTNDFILKNKKYGNLNDLINLKGFIIEALDSSQNGQTITIFSHWQNYLSKPLVKIINYLIFAIILIGLIKLISKNKKTYLDLSLIMMFFLIFSLMATDTFPFSLISKIFLSVPILKQAFRVTFTKFSISLAFFYSVFLGLGLNIIFSSIRNKRFLYMLYVIFFINIIIISFPVFQGNLFYKRIKVNIPNQYFQLFSYFNNQNKNERIVHFPIGWHWGWSVYKWGYSGSGFLWYGIEQPIIDRSFDVWGSNNENFYWEISQAVFSENYQSIDSIFKKYNVSWIIFDKNIIPYQNPKSILYSDKVENYFDHSNNYEIVKTLSPTTKTSKEIKIYKFKYSFNKETKILKDIPNVEPKYDFTNYDQAYYQFGNYYYSKNIYPNVFYPFRSLFTNRKYLNNLNFDYEKYPLIYSSKNDEYFLNHKAGKCGIQLDNKYKLDQITTKNSVLFYSENVDNCYNILLDTLNHRNSYLIKITLRHINGKPLQLAIINNQTKKTDIELVLTDKKTNDINYLIIPPMDYYGVGYTLSFNNSSIGKDASSNELYEIKIYEIPYYDLINKYIIKNDSNVKNSVLFQNQSFDSDWIAISNNQLFKHVMVNNWANGWIIPNNQEADIKSVKIIFWPQYLEYLGFILLATSFFAILKIKDNHE